MCAIAGVWMPGHSDPAALAQWASAMASAMAHRGPDGQGVWWDPTLQLALSHRRLAIRDIGPGAQQPMEHPARLGVLVFNGEIDNHQVWRQELERSAGSLGHRDPESGRCLFSTGDTEVLLHALNRWGADRVCDRAQGMWAWAYFDRDRRELLLSRDRLGKKPLYWLEAPWGMAFASQLQAFRHLPMWAPRISPSGLAQYLRWGFVEGEASMLDGVHRVEPGQTLVFKNARCVNRRRHWSVANAWALGVQDRITTAGQAQDALLATLRQAVADRLQADVPVGALLSGGVDSSLVVALMQEQGAQTRTFSIGFDSAEHDESDQAQAIAKALGTHHHSTRVTGRMAAEWLERLPRIMDEPLADASLIPTAILAHQAARSVKVVLTGDGGDEAFGGYARYRLVTTAWHRLAQWPAPIRTGLATLLSRVPPAFWNTLARGMPARWQPTLPASKADKLVRWLQASDPLQRSVVGLQRWHPLELWPQAPTGGDANSLRLPGSLILTPAEAAQAASEASSSEWLQAWEVAHYLSGDLLAKMDRATMWASLEARSPLLDHRVMDLAWRIPPSLKAEGPRLKEVLRLCLERFLPRTLFDRPKRGFSAPLERWLQHELREPASDLMHSLMRHVDGRWNTRLMAQAWDAQQAGRAHHPDRLWTLIILEMWRREWGLDLP